MISKSLDRKILIALSLTVVLIATIYIRKPVDFDQFVDTVKQIGFYWLLVNEQARR